MSIVQACYVTLADNQGCSFGSRARVCVCGGVSGWVFFFGSCLSMCRRRGKPDKSVILNL